MPSCAGAPLHECSGQTSHDQTATTADQTLMAFGWTDNSQDLGAQRLAEVSQTREDVPKIAMHLVWQQKRGGPKSPDQEREEFFDIIDEAHSEHLIGFIQNH